MASVSIIRTGAANLASVQAAFLRLGTEARVVDRPSELSANDRVVLPGVGAFETGIQTLRQQGWERILLERFENDLPTLAICLGLQLLCRDSEEAPGATGLGIMPTSIRKFPEEVSVPQLGWNQIVEASPPFDQPADQRYVYFANSYCAADIDELKRVGWNVAVCQHGIRFVAAASRGNWLTCQFHPELSGRFGRVLLSSWLTGALGDSAEVALEEDRSC